MVGTGVVLLASEVVVLIGSVTEDADARSQPYVVRRHPLVTRGEISVRQDLQTDSTCYHFSQSPIHTEQRIGRRRRLEPTPSTHRLYIANLD